MKAAGLNTLVGVCVAFFTRHVFCGELTFELPDKEKMCFHEEIEKDVSSVLEYQVDLDSS